jgi:hypothetical protein
MTKTAYAKRFTPEEKAEYHKRQREQAQTQLESAVASLQSSDGFREWLRARALFHGYSLNNTFLIHAQCPEATRVASAKVWRELGRHQVKGSTALRVYAPMEWHVDAKGQQPGEVNQWGQVAFQCDKHKRVCVRAKTFKLVPVFDVSQTDGEPLPDPPVPAPIDGDSHAHLEPALVSLANEIGFSVSTEVLGDGSGGYCNHTAKAIVVAEGQASNARVRVLVHEIAHALGVGYKEYGRGPAETIVEAVTYIVLAGQGLATDESSVPYVTGWGEGEATDTIRKFAETIDTIARRIESAL